MPTRVPATTASSQSEVTLSFGRDERNENLLGTTPFPESRRELPHLGPTSLLLLGVHVRFCKRSKLLLHLKAIGWIEFLLVEHVLKEEDAPGRLIQGNGAPQSAQKS